MDNPNEAEKRTDPAVAPLSDSQLIDAMGGSAAVARFCRVKSPAVSYWRRNGIPDYRRQALATLRPDLFPEEAGRNEAARTNAAQLPPEGSND